MAKIIQAKTAAQNSQLVDKSLLKALIGFDASGKQYQVFIDTLAALLGQIPNFFLKDQYIAGTTVIPTDKTPGLSYLLGAGTYTEFGNFNTTADPATGTVPANELWIVTWNGTKWNGIKFPINLSGYLQTSQMDVAGGVLGNDLFNLYLSGGLRQQTLTPDSVISNQVFGANGVLSTAMSWNVLRVSVTLGDVINYTGDSESGIRAIGIFTSAGVYNGVLATYSATTGTAQTIQVTATVTGYIYINQYKGGNNHGAYTLTKSISIPRLLTSEDDVATSADLTDVSESLGEVATNTETNTTNIASVQSVVDAIKNRTGETSGDNWGAVDSSTYTTVTGKYFGANGVEVTGSSWNYLKVPVSAGDRFQYTVVSNGGSSQRAVGAMDSSSTYKGNIAFFSGALGDTLTFDVTAPNDGYLLFNVYAANNYTYSLKKYNSSGSTVPIFAIQEDMDSLTARVADLETGGVVLPESGYDRYTADVKNRSSVNKTNEPVYLTFEFPYGKVKGIEYIAVLDNNGTIIPAQWLPDMKVKRGDNLNMGYWSDGSLRSGAVVIVDTIATGVTKGYTVRAYSSKIYTTATKPPVAQNIVRGSYTFGFSSSLGNQLQTITFGGVSSIVRHWSEYYTYVDQSSNTLVNDVAIGGVMTITNWGNVFTEVTITGSVAGFIRETIYRLFDSGKVTIHNIFRTTQIINGTADKITSNIRMYLTNGSANQSTAYSMFGTTGFGTKGFACCLSVLGQTHREGTQYELTWQQRGTSGANSSGGTYTMSEIVYRTPSATVPVIQKNEAFIQYTFIDVNSSYATIAQAEESASLPIVGFLGAVANRFVTRAHVLNKVYELMKGRTDFLAASFGENATGSSMQSYILGKLGVFKWSNKKYTWSALWANFNANIVAAFGGWSTLGNKYLDNTWGLQFTSRYITEQLYFYFKEATKQGDTTALASLTSGINSLATAMVTQWDTTGNVPLNPSNSSNSNSNASAFEILSVALKTVGDNAAGDYARVANALETYLAGFFKNNTAFTDGLSDVLASSHYLHYAMYAAYGYYRGCQIQGKTPLYDMTNYILNSVAGYGALRENIWCLSNSRRGLKESYSYAISLLLWAGGTSGANAAIKLYEHLLSQLKYDGTFEIPMDNWYNIFPTGDYYFELGYNANLLLSECY